MTLDSYGARALHLTALWAYGVSQPIFALLSGNSEVFALRSSSRTDVVTFAVTLTLGPPLLALAYVRFVACLSRWAGDRLYAIFFGAFLAPLALQLVTSAGGDGRPALLLVLILAVTGVLSYLRWRAVRLFLSFSILLPIVGTLSFAHGIPSFADQAHASRVRDAPRLPVVVVVFDEFPLTSLLKGDGLVDGVRYPHFARLAREATWYPNATTVHDSTRHATPAILTGRMPDRDDMPILSDHPGNLFTLFGSSSKLRVHEALTRLCPEEHCPRRERSLVDRIDGLTQEALALYLNRVLPASFGGSRDSIALDRLALTQTRSANDDFDGFLREFSPGEPNDSVHFIHLLVPHMPWRFLPSGRNYGFDATPVGMFAAEEVWVDDPWFVTEGYQQHLLQVGYTDRLLGRLLRRLERVGLYDRALVVVVADHGASFRPGRHRRGASSSNLSDIANVPLFVKYPGQVRGRVDLRPARTVDLVPTIADVLDLRVPWRADGESLLGARTDRAGVVVHTGSRRVTAPLAALVHQRKEAVRRKTELFGEGHDSLYRIGVSTHLLGRAVGSRPSSSVVRVRIEDADQLAKVRLSSPFVPTRIAGVVIEGEVAPATELAVAVNGRVWALTRCFRWGGRQQFRALVPESALREGPNQVDVYAVEAGGARLVRLTG